MKRPILLLLLTNLAFLLQATPLREDFQVEDLGLSLEQMEDKLLALANEERGRYGLPVLARDPGLRAMAREHSRRMIAAGRLAHDLLGHPGLEDRAAAVGLHFSKVGENVARSATFVVRFFHEALMASPSHRENILDREYTHLGVGIAQSGDLHYATQEFARLYEPVPPVEMERQMEERIAGRFPAGMALSGADRAALRDHCRLTSRAFLNGVTPARLPDSYGSALIVTLAFTEAEAGFLKLLQQIKGVTPLSWLQGVAFARSPAYPGGAFALTVILFPDLRAALQEGETPEARVFAALQCVHPFKRNLSLDWAAERIATTYRQAPERVESGRLSYRRHAVYQGLSLDGLPVEIREWTGERKTVRSVGIHVLYPLSAGLPGNYFIVAIVGN